MYAKMKDKMSETTVRVYVDDLGLLREIQKEQRFASLEDTLHWILSVRLPNLLKLADIVWDASEEPISPEKYLVEISGLGKQGQKSVRVVGKLEKPTYEYHTETMQLRGKLRTKKGEVKCP